MIKENIAKDLFTARVVVDPDSFEPFAEVVSTMSMQALYDLASEFETEEELQMFIGKCYSDAVELHRFKNNAG